MNQLREEQRLRKSKINNNKLDKQSKTTNPSKIDAICAQNVWNFMLDASTFIEDQ